MSCRHVNGTRKNDATKSHIAIFMKKKTLFDSKDQDSGFLVQVEMSHSNVL